MKKLIDIIERYHLIFLLIVYLVCGICLIKCYRYNLSPDGVSYLTIAEKYAAGNFSDAVNGYWGPMISWLMVPLLLLGVEPILSIKILNLIIGVPTILAMWWLSGSLELSLPTRRIILLPAVIYVLYFANLVVTPDLLLSCALLLYFIFIFRQRYIDSSKQGFLCGLWGGIAYLVKSFAFPFFISHFFLMNFIHFLTHKSKTERKTILANFFCGLIVFSIISGFWITAISCKYKKLTFSTAKDINFYFYVTSSYLSFHADKWHNKGLYPPPNKTAISAWEDPYFIFDSLPAWSPYESSDSFRHYIKVIIKNIGGAAKILNKFSFLSAFIFIAYLWIIFSKPGKILNRPAMLYPFASLLLLIGGYSMIQLIERLIWPSVFLLLLMAGFVIDRLHQNTFFTRLPRIAVYVILIVSFSILPVKTLANRVFTEIYRPETFNPKKWVGVLGKYIQVGDSIASNKDWAETQFLSFFLKAQYYGVVGENAIELHKYRIQHLFVWGKPVPEELSIPGYRELGSNQDMGLTIYSLIDDKHSIGPVR